MMNDGFFKAIPPLTQALTECADNGIEAIEVFNAFLQIFQDFYPDDVETIQEHLQ